MAGPIEGRSSERCQDPGLLLAPIRADGFGAWCPLVGFHDPRRLVRADIGLLRQWGDDMAGQRLDNPSGTTVKRLVRLHRSRGRREQGRFLAEGERVIAGFLAAGWRPLAAYLADGLPAPTGWPGEEDLVRVGERALGRISQATTPSGLLMEFALPEPVAIDPAIGGLVLVGLADPGNVGTLIRSATAFGLQQVVLVDSVDPWAAKVVQASAGSLALARLACGSGPEALGDLPLVGLIAADGAGPGALPEAPAWLAVGSEAHGLPEVWQAACTHRLRLPMPGGTESLNAGVAGAIAAFLLQGLHHH